MKIEGLVWEIAGVGDRRFDLNSYFVITLVFGGKLEKYDGVVGSWIVHEIPVIYLVL